MQSSKYGAPAGRDGHTVSLLVTADETKPSYSGDGGRFHIKLSAITLTPENKPRNLSHWDSPVVTPRGSFLLGDFQVSSQGNRKDAPRVEGQSTYDTRSLYAFSVEFHGYQILRLETAQAMVKTLGTVERHLEKQNYQVGPPSTFAAYVRRVADALGITQITWLVSKGGNGHSYDDNTYRTVGVEAGCLFIEATETAWMSGKNGDALPLVPTLV